MQKFYKKKLVENFEFCAKIAHGNKKIECKAFLDSGNLLFDEQTNLPINFVSLVIFEKLFDDLSFEDVLRKSEKLKKLSQAHFANFDTFGGSGRVFVFQIDELILGDKISKNVMLGLCLKSLVKSLVRTLCSTMLLRKTRRRYWNLV